MFLGTIVAITTRAEVCRGVDSMGARPIITVQVRDSTVPNDFPPEVLQSSLEEIVMKKDEDGKIMRAARRDAQQMADRNPRLAWCTAPFYEYEIVQ